MSWNDIEGNGNFDDKEKIPYTKFEQGNTVIRILDGEPYSFWSHWAVKQNMGITCLGKDCPICDVVKQQKADGVEKKTYNSSKRHAMRILNKNTGRMEIMLQGKQFMQDLYTYHKEIGDLRDYDIKVVRKGTETDTKYTLLPCPPAPLTDAEKALISEVDLPEVLKPYDKDVIIKLMEGKTLKEIFGNGDEE